MGTPIGVSSLRLKWKAIYTVYLTQGKKQGTNKLYGWVGQSQYNSQRDTQNRPDDTKKSGRDPKLYTGELFLEK